MSIKDIEMNISQDCVAEFFNDMQKFFRFLKLKKEDLEQDLKAASLSIPAGKVCDFGCGEGFTTLSLVSKLEVSEGIGVDKNESHIAQAKLWLKAIIKYIELSEGIKIQDDKLKDKVYHLLGIKQFPEFRVGDVVTGQGLPLPLNIDVAYCNLLLVNIYNSAYENRVSGKIGVESAIKNIARTINPGGYFLAIEQYNQEIDFRHLFEEAGLKGEAVPFSRRPITLEGRGIAEWYIRYIYKNSN